MSHTLCLVLITVSTVIQQHDWTSCGGYMINLLTSRKGTVIGSSPRITIRGKKHVPKVNVRVCYHRVCEWENLLGGITTTTTPQGCLFYQTKPLLLEDNRSCYKEDFFIPAKFIQVPSNADFILSFIHITVGLIYRITIQSVLIPTSDDPPQRHKKGQLPYLKCILHKN